MFDISTYVTRRKQLLAQMDSGLILLSGNEESPMNFTENVYPFRQDSTFLYYSGLDHPHLAILLDVDEEKVILFGDEPTIEEVVWMGPQPSLAGRAGEVGINETAPFIDLAAHLQKARKQDRPIHYLPPYRHDIQIWLHKWLERSLDEVKSQASLPLIKAVVSQRSLKSEAELREMELAVAISGAMHEAAMKAARPGIREAHLAGIAEGIAVAAGGQLAYPIIMTVNGQTLHNHSHDNELASGQLVLGDFGAETGLHYAGDITRTFPVDPKFTGRQQDIYQIVLEAQLAALEYLQPGRRFLDAHLLAARTITEGLKALGLMQGDTEEAIQQGAHALFFPHGLGHMIGLDVHDMENLGEDFVGYSENVSRSDQFGLQSLRFAKAMQPGHVLTVEPGIYFIPELIDQWKGDGKFKDFIKYDMLDDYLDFGGIRLEDNVAITEEGCRLLGNPIPKTIEEVEAIRQQ
jgi:Xaa-Pro aminopeptidase